MSTSPSPHPHPPSSLEDMAPEYVVRLIIVGDSGCGKTSLLLRYVDDRFSPSFLSTVGIDFRLKTLQINGSVVKVQIFDTSGQERFKTITKAYYRNADGALLLYDITNENSFNRIKEWAQEMEPHIINAAKFLVGNKSDLENLRVIPREQGVKLAREIGYKFMETSALSGSNVTSVFDTILDSILSNIPSLVRNITPEKDNTQPTTITVADNKKPEPGSCPC